jgi:8-amino-7-oxononanoate synthase
MSLATTERKKLHYIISAWKEIFNSGTESPIQVINGNSTVHTKALAARAQKAGFDIRPIFSPTVPQGKERLRVCLHAFNTEEELMHLHRTLSEAV